MWFSSWLGKRQCSALSGRSHGAARKRPTCRPRLESLEDRWLPSQIGLTVTSLADSGPGTLRAAILRADTGSPSDKFTIGFAVNGTIDLQSPLPDLANSIDVQGPGASSLTVERAAGASFASAIVTVDAGQTASLSGLTLSNGNAGGIVNSGTLAVASSAILNNVGSPHGGTPFVVSLGGGIFSSGTLTVSGSTVSGNSASQGGGIFSSGTLTVSGSIVSDNTASFAGGIRNFFGSLTISSSTVSGNSALSCGGISNTRGPATISDCTLSGNSAEFGVGCILSEGPATVSGCTLSYNSANEGSGGAIFSSGAFGFMTIRNSTFTGNSATGGGGGAIGNGFGGTMTVSGCTFSHNTANDVTLSNGFVVVGKGGAIDNEYSLAVRDSTFTGNSATEGGAIYNEAPGFVSMVFSGCTLIANTASDSGGAIYNLGTATLQQCTLSGNTAGADGGGIFNAAGMPSGLPVAGFVARYQDSTLSDNTAGSAGGGIFNVASAALTVEDSIVLNNVAPLGADIYNLGALTLNDSTVGVIGP